MSAAAEPGAATLKIAVVGNTGSGKSTIARHLASALGVPHVELDSLFWRPGWEMAPTHEFRASVKSALAVDGWVVDGNYFGRLGDEVLKRADLVLWLDLPLPTILGRLLRRTLRRVRTREELWGTNRDTWRGAFLARDSLFVWAVKGHLKRPERGAMIAKYSHVRLRTALDVERWLESFTRPAMTADTRVVVLGVSGSGKTTLARRLARGLGARYVDMNAMLGGPAGAVRARVDSATASGGWIADASLARHIGDHLLDRVDAVVWLDLPLRTVLARLWRRSRGEREVPVIPMLGAVRSHVSNRRCYERRFARVERVVRLRTARQVEEWATLVT